MKTLSFRFAKEKDVNKILYFIKELAAYEKAILTEPTRIAVERGCGRGHFHIY